MKHDVERGAEYAASQVSERVAEYAASQVSERAAEYAASHMSEYAAEYAVSQVSELTAEYPASRAAERAAEQALSQAFNRVAGHSGNLADAGLPPQPPTSTPTPHAPLRLAGSSIAAQPGGGPGTADPSGGVAPSSATSLSSPPAPPLRRGYTTGACAAAAAKGAALLLITGDRLHAVEIDLPAGFRHTFELTGWQREGSGFAACATVKDAGDDPDATHQAWIEATVTWLDHPGVEIDGGRGVGRVTKPGLPMPVGAAAINPVPRRMIVEAVSGVLEEHGAARGLRVVISVPEGEAIALRTLNPRLGIIGGISILGTRGVVTPFSTDAYKASVVQAISVAAATGNGQIILTTGGSSEKYAMAMFSGLPEEAFIQMGEYVGFSLEHAKAYGIRKVTFVGMAGKFSKVAQGAMLIHSRNAPVDFGFLAAVAAEAGADAGQVKRIIGANTASQVVDMMTEAGNSAFFELLCRQACEQSLKHMNGGLTVEMILITMKGRLLGRAEICG